MENAKKAPGNKKSSIRHWKVNVVYGEMALTECMKNVIKGKSILKELKINFK